MSIGLLKFLISMEDGVFGVLSAGEWVARHLNCFLGSDFRTTLSKRGVVYFNLILLVLVAVNN
jgi:hypothetical protein